MHSGHIVLVMLRHSPQSPINEPCLHVQVCVVTKHTACCDVQMPPLNRCHHVQGGEESRTSEYEAKKRDSPQTSSSTCWCHKRSQSPVTSRGSKHEQLGARRSLVEENRVLHRTAHVMMSMPMCPRFSTPPPLWSSDMRLGVPSTAVSVSPARKTVGRRGKRKVRAAVTGYFHNEGATTRSTG